MKHRFSRRFFVFFTAYSLLSATFTFAITPQDGTVPTRPMYKNGQPPTPQFPAPRQAQRRGLGIVSHQVYSASSPDGLNWTKDGTLHFDSASVPEAVLTPESDIRLYFMDASKGHEMSVALSRDGGKTWKKKKVQIANRQEKDGEAVDPNLIRLSDGTYRMFYFGSFVEGGPQPVEGGRVYAIYSATSKDGVHFTEEKGARFSKSAVITDPDAVQTPTGWRFFVSQGQTNVESASSDGLNFEETGTHLVGAISKTVAMDDGYRMYYCSHGGIASRFTRDFKTWREEGVRLSPDPQRILCDPSVIRLKDGTYKMFYKTAPMGNKPPQLPLPPR